jgi:hypothetical protein
MSGNNPTPNELPTYILNGDYASQEFYHELLNTILTQWFNSNGFFNPSLTTAQVASLLAMDVPPPKGTRWFNSDLDKEQFVGNTGAVQTINSSY